MKNPINPQTVMCISLAARPSPFGMTVHNAGYQALGLNFFYKAFAPKDLKGAIAGVRSLGIRGCSVSMPFKEEVVKYLDRLDPAARAIGAVNTIVNENGKLTGYNTDALGARQAIAEAKIDRRCRVLLLGSGGVARAIVYALKDLGFKDVTVANRSPARVRALKKIFPVKVCAWPERNAFRADFIINATSIGMTPKTDEMPVAKEALKYCRAVQDVVISPLQSCLIAQARRMKKTVVPGHQMSLYQAMAQFKLYTGHAAPEAAMRKAMMDLLS